MPFSREPRDLTRFVEKIGEYVDKQGGFADVWRCTLSRKDGGSGRELVRKFLFFAEDVILDITP